MDKNISDNIIEDGLNLYAATSEYLSQREKKEVMHEGFNAYTHDFLLRRQTQLSPRIALDRENERNAEYWARKAREAELDKEPFPLEDAFLALEYKTGSEYERNAKGERVKVPDEARWCFYDGARQKTSCERTCFLFMSRRDMILR